MEGHSDANNAEMSYNPTSGVTIAMTNNSDQLDNLSNLIINNNSTNNTGYTSGYNTLGLLNAEDENVLLEQYERDLDKGLSENLLNEKEQCYQRLFQSFQTSACTVAQMFKDKTSTSPAAAPPSTTSASQQTSNPSTTTNQLTPWQSFQNSAGAITVLYKGKTTKT
jgi:hypothetical protein